MYFTGECFPTCLGCSGGSGADAAFACYECRKNSYRDNSGTCICHPDWAVSMDCTVFDGDCDSKCLDGLCSGPYAYQCTKCTENAHRDSYGRCVCDDYWSGPNCDLYQGRCHCSCATCVGP